MYNMLMGKGNITIVQVNNNQFTTTIPRSLGMAMSLTKGIELEWTVGGKDTIIIKKLLPKRIGEE